MNPQHHAKRQLRSDEDGTAGLMALIVLLVVVVCTAASLLISVPQTLEAAVNTATSGQELTAARSAEPTFHERYPVNSGEETVNAPSF
jgi:hypothetical protein